MRETVKKIGKQVEDLMKELVFHRLNNSLEGKVLEIWIDVFDELLICQRLLREVELGDKPCTASLLEELEMGVFRVQSDLMEFFPRIEQ